MLYSFVAHEGQKLGEKYGMSQCGTGGGVDKGIWLMTLAFEYCGKKVNEQEARKIIINCLHDYLKAVNEDEELRPYLKNYPFTPKNIAMRIFFFGEGKKTIYYPYVAVVSAKEGNIIFFTNDQEIEYTYKTKNREAYEESIAKLANEK